MYYTNTLKKRIARRYEAMERLVARYNRHIATAAAANEWQRVSNLADAIAELAMQLKYHKDVKNA